MNEIRFLHIRNHTKEGTLCPNGGATVAISKADSKHYVFNVAHCSDKDVFCKKLGRAVASGRLQKHRTELPYADKNIVVENLRSICKQFNTAIAEHQIVSLLKFN